jgi:hypothetical protein
MVLDGLNSGDSVRAISNAICSAATKQDAEERRFYTAPGKEHVEKRAGSL